VDDAGAAAGIVRAGEIFELIEAARLRRGKALHGSAV
jgi:osmoprotectant transport system ATP-binding protein